MNKLPYQGSRTTIFMDPVRKERLLQRIAQRNANRREGDPKITITGVFERAADNFIDS